MEIVEYKLLFFEKMIILPLRELTNFTGSYDWSSLASVESITAHLYRVVFLISETLLVCDIVSCTAGEEVLITQDPLLRKGQRI